MKLTDKKCIDGATRLRPADIKKLKKQLAGDWKVAKGKLLERKFKFPDFKKALAFTNRVGQLAEKQWHHPDIYLTWGEVRIQLSSHSAGGLTENDFIMAAKLGKLT